MSKKWLVIGGGGVLLSIITSIIVWKWDFQKKPGEAVNPVVTENKSLVSEKRLTWDDPAGFTFEYPDDVVIDKHDEDQENYAHVEMTHSEHPGKIIVWAKDLPVVNGRTIKTPDEWVKSVPEFASANVLDTTLGGEEAKKILTNSKEKMLTIGMVFDDLLWYIEGSIDDDKYWSEVEDVIVDSFKFKPTQTSTKTSVTSGDSSAGGVDEEEVLE